MEADSEALVEVASSAAVESVVSAESGLPRYPSDDANALGAAASTQHASVRFHRGLLVCASPASRIDDLLAGGHGAVVL